MTCPRRAPGPTASALALAGLCLAAPAIGQDADEEPFLLMVEGVNSISGIGTVVNGTVDRGRIAVGDRVDIIGGNAERGSIVTSISVGREQREAAEAGERVGISLRGLLREDVQRGYAVAAEGTLPSAVVIRVRIESLDAALEPFRNGDGRSGLVLASLAPEGFAAEFRERWILPDGVGPDPTAPFDLILVLDSARPVEGGWRVILRGGGVEIARGTVREIVF